MSRSARCRDEHHADRLAQLALASGGTLTARTLALARWIDSHLPKGGTPLWLRIRKVGSGIRYVGARKTRPALLR
jgi:hypothetical protein